MKSIWLVLHGTWMKVLIILNGWQFMLWPYRAGFGSFYTHVIHVALTWLKLSKNICEFDTVGSTFVNREPSVMDHNYFSLHRLSWVCTRTPIPTITSVEPDLYFSPFTSILNCWYHPVCWCMWVLVWILWAFKLITKQASYAVCPGGQTTNTHFYKSHSL